jgi:hypothetical protein
MKAFFAIACVASLFLAGNTFARTGGTTASSHRNTKNFGNYHRTHGRSFSHGYYYQGRNHHQWSNYRWSSRYGCYTYYCPSAQVYYYWSEPTQCYYPMSYADTVAPTRSQQLMPINYNAPGE